MAARSACVWIFQYDWSCLCMQQQQSNLFSPVYALQDSSDKIGRAVAKYTSVLACLWTEWTVYREHELSIN